MKRPPSLSALLLVIGFDNELFGEHPLGYITINE
jgi:hypothetical protein